MIPSFVRNAAKPLQFDYVLDNFIGSPRVQAYRNGKLIGSLYTYGDDNNTVKGEIANLDVLPRYRRKGVARGMAQHAIDNGVQLYHSNALTPDGKAFAKSVPLPRVWNTSDSKKIVPWEHGQPGGDDPNAYRIPVDDFSWKFDGAKFRQDFDAAPEWTPGMGAALYPKQIKSAKVTKTAVRWEDWSAENPGNELSFQYKANRATVSPNDWAVGHRIEAILNGKKIGFADIAGENSDHSNPGEIQMISVDRPYRMRGIGRAMLQHAHKMGLNPTHSAFLTPDGMEFAENTPEFPSSEDYAWA